MAVQHKNARFLVGVGFIVVLILLALGGCTTGPGHMTIVPTATFTVTVTPSPTVCPTIVLPSAPSETPNALRTLYIVVYDPDEARSINVGLNQNLSLRDAIYQFVESVVKGGDRIVLLQMGCRYYDFVQCRKSNFLLPTPKPVGTVVPPSPTPLPTLTPVPTAELKENETLFRATQIARDMLQTATAVAPTATAIARMNVCAESAWKEEFLTASQAMQATQQAFATQIAGEAATAIAPMSMNSLTPTPTPYTQEAVFDALYQISGVLRNEREHFDRFVVVIFDSMEDWRLNLETGQIHDLSFENGIDLGGAQVLMVMPDCKEVYDPPYCETRANTWRSVLKGKFNALMVEPIPNSQALEKIVQLASP